MKIGKEEYPEETDEREEEVEEKNQQQLNLIMRQSLRSQPRQVDLRIHKVGEYKTRFQSYQ